MGTMRRRRYVRASVGIAAALLVSLAGCAPDPGRDQAAEAGTAPVASDFPRGEASPFDGYTLFQPLRSTTVYLVDMEGETVHTWETEYNGGSVYMLDNGNIIREVREPEPVGEFTAGGEGGIIQEIAWDGTVVWEFRYSTEEYRHHHDIAPLPNGNVLLIAWERKTFDEALEAGISRARFEEDAIWPDTVVEIEPLYPDGGNVVWEWRVWDHLVQDFDRSKANYGVIAEHPELIDINAAAPHRERRQMAAPEEVERLRALGYLGGGSDADDRPEIARDWLHTNSIAYDPDRDEIILSVRSFSEFWIIDHSTTTEEAAGHIGGRRGKGGDLLYRWGNPEASGTGTSDDRTLFVQHNAQVIPRDRAGGGNILVFNNGTGRAEEPWSSVDEIAPPFDADGNYIMEPGVPTAPAAPVWSYTDPVPTNMYAPIISGAQRLPNGNTLICAGEGGKLREIGADGHIVWEYQNPYLEEAGTGAEGQGQGGPGPGSLFRALRIAVDHPALASLLTAEARRQ